MAFDIVKAPKKTIMTLEADIVMANNPNVFILQRNDISWNALSNNGGKIRLTINSVNVTSEYVSGNDIYFKSTNPISAYFTGLAGKITASAFVSGNTRIDTDIDIFPDALSDATGGLIVNFNLFPNYHVRILAQSAGRTLGALIFYPGKTGLLYCDISSIISLYLSLDIPWDIKTLVEGVPTFQNAIDNKIAQEIKFFSSQRWDGNIEADAEMVGQDIVVINGANRIPATYGANTFVDNVYSSSAKGKFLQLMDEVVVYSGHPFSLSYINKGSGSVSLLAFNKAFTYSTAHEGVVSLSFKSPEGDKGTFRLGTLTDAVILSATSDQEVSYSSERWLAQTFNGANARYVIKVETASASVASDPKLFSAELWELDVNDNVTGKPKIIIQAINNILYVPNTVYHLDFSDSLLSSSKSYALVLKSDQSRSMFVKLNSLVTNGRIWSSLDLGKTWINAGAHTLVLKLTLITISEIIAPLPYKVEPKCDNTVVLWWRNSKGGESWFSFKHSQELSTQFSSSRKNYRKRLRAESVTKKQWIALQELNSSNEIYQVPYTELDNVERTVNRVGANVFQVFEDGSKVGVIIIPTTSRTETRQYRHEFETTIEYPQEYDVAFEPGGEPFEL